MEKTKKPRHGNTYCCRRLRMLEWLRSRGWMPYAVVPDCQNPKYSVWLFDNTQEGFEDDVYFYFTEVLKKK